MPTIRFVTSNAAVDFPEGDDVNLLRVAIRNDCNVPYKCASGNCGTDRVLVVDGAENLSPPRNASASGSASCSTRATGCAARPMRWVM